MKTTVTTMIAIIAGAVVLNFSNAYAEHKDPTWSGRSIAETQSVHKCPDVNTPKQNVDVPSQERNSK